jgi:hypothetical protein
VDIYLAAALRRAPDCAPGCSGCTVRLGDTMTLRDFLFRGDLSDLDPAVADLINLETERQIRRLILIPSESTIPWAVRHVLASPFVNIYAEGYPPEETRAMSEAEILDFDARLADFRRYSTRAITRAPRSPI